MLNKSDGMLDDQHSTKRIFMDGDGTLAIDRNLVLNRINLWVWCLNSVFSHSTSYFRLPTLTLEFLQTR